MIDFQLVVQHRAAGVLTSTNFNLDALVDAKRMHAEGFSFFQSENKVWLTDVVPVNCIQQE
jgi:RNA:NAD 2'-phosphotransferase (TPT1/KptA family)